MSGNTRSDSGGFEPVPVNTEQSAYRSISQVAAKLKGGSDFLSHLQQKASTTRRGYIRTYPTNNIL